MADSPSLRNLTVEDARARILAGAARLGIESVALEQSLGRVLAEPVVADRAQPPFDASAMDGWAIRRADYEPSKAFAVAGESAAGKAYPRVVEAGQAVRIFTGAPVPAGADLVIIQEEAVREGGAVRFEAGEAPKANIRAAGGDFQAGAALLEAGAVIDPWRLSLVASAGLAQVPVARRPRVAILATGDELVPPGAAPRADQIFESGSFSLAALVEAWGGEAFRLKAQGDDAAAIAASVGPVEADLIVTIGGASVGDHDLVKPALRTLGLTLAVETVAVRPGKPTWFGTLEDGRRVLGLPGNPASALVCAELFLKPPLAALTGADPQVRLSAARLVAPLSATGPREHWMRARLAVDAEGRLTADAFPDQDSSLIGVFSQADALLRRRPGAPAAQAGDTVEVLPLRRG
ncbi:molybdopterin molybdenumtransferase MoeA [Caulobacter segnis]|uniref:Molybdopterin molybdenumtransferase n=2 Tax=Caulobacter segnis TaxID=88688 RepID=D5VHX3_CAUST|nr:gephyrin-like molybdotransferase Glp [Caulobacter segnis]ADG09226.1 molybdenum cofactor synthesis domain protein [Caulobacter segnis ATCC 21756]AVQ01041.1 molybdopterin molybdenumtransferase MoeA [Caulobacter segnis]